MLVCVYSLMRVVVRWCVSFLSLLCGECCVFVGVVLFWGFRCLSFVACRVLFVVVCDWLLFVM